MTSPCKRWLLALSLAGACSMASAFASTGHIVDHEGRPVEGGKVCYIAGRAETYCVKSDENGYYKLPTSRLTEIRVHAPGFLPIKLSAIPRSAPVRLEQAASIIVKLEDATTRGPVADGKITIVASSGQTLGPLPTYASGVMEFLTLRPGDVIVNAAAEGYEASEGHPVELVAGERAEVSIRLRPKPKNSTDG